MGCSADLSRRTGTSALPKEMNAKKLNVGEQQIGYYESVGTGRPIMLIHGNSSSGKSFQKQLEGDFGETYRVVAVDLPGHGASGNSADPANTYHMPGYAAVMVDVAKQLGIEEAVIVGWSLGGHIALEMAQYMPNAAGIVIFGTPPLAYPPDMEAGFLPNPAMAAAFNPELSDEERAGFVNAFFAPNTSDIPAFFDADAKRTDGIARATMAGSIAPGNYTDEVQVVGTMAQPLAILHGEHEQLVNGDYFASVEMPTLWRGAAQIVPSAGHAPQWENAEAFNRLLVEFVESL